MSTEYVFRPRPKRDPFIATDQTSEAMSLTDSAHDYPSVVVWTGPSGAGKTWAAREMIRRINSSYREDNPDSFQARYEEVCSDERTYRRRGAISGIRRLYNALVGTIEPYVFNHMSEEDLARRIVRRMRKNRIQMVFVDEAGTLQVEELRGMVHVRNVAEAMDWPFTLVLIGMDELPERVTVLPQVERRVVHWAFFKPYPLDKDWWRLLAGLHPHFASLDAERASDQAQVEYVHRVYRGLLGELMTFLRRLSLRMRQAPDVPVDLEYLETVYAELQLSKQQAMIGAETRFRKPLPSDEDLLNAIEEAATSSPVSADSDSADEVVKLLKRGPRHRSRARR